MRIWIHSHLFAGKMGRIMSEQLLHPVGADRSRRASGGGRCRKSVDGAGLRREVVALVATRDAELRFIQRAS
jgi:hypothetical protein